MNAMFRMIGGGIARYLSKRRHTHSPSTATPPDRLLACLKPGDVLLVDGDTRVSAAIKYLTQSTWSHAALFVGGHETSGLNVPGHFFVEADLVGGVRSVGIEEFKGLHTRICRPVGLTVEECRAVTKFAVDSIGHQYDLRNVFDLARYLLPTPPVPARFRRRMIALGSGDPTRAICSTLISQAFQTINYPVLPMIEHRPAARDDCQACMQEVLHIRDHSLFTPRDFDVSPYFEIIKPSIIDGFDFRTLKWERTT